MYKDEDVIKAVSADPSKPEFLVPSSNPYYRIPYGSQSHYGDHIPPVLRSIAQCKGTVHILKQKITCRQTETKRNNSIIIIITCKQDMDRWCILYHLLIKLKKSFE